MKTKLTLRIEKRLIKKAKEHAKNRNTSVSQLVADYLAAIEAPDAKKKAAPGLPPITSQLTGILKSSAIDEKAYKTHLEKKHLE